jgi:hypothetical protein
VVVVFMVVVCGCWLESQECQDCVRLSVCRTPTRGCRILPPLLPRQVCLEEALQALLLLLLDEERLLGALPAAQRAVGRAYGERVSGVTVSGAE